MLLIGINSCFITGNEINSNNAKFEVIKIELMLKYRMSNWQMNLFFIFPREASQFEVIKIELMLSLYVGFDT